MNRFERTKVRIDEGVRRFAERCESFGEYLERIGREGMVKADEWEKSMQIKIDKLFAQDRK